MSSVENIGARRLQTVMERLLDDVSFDAEDRKGETIKYRCRLCRDSSYRGSRRTPIFPNMFSDC
jgi:ATP-dependent protease HslVU (ClpYQ) ATPase subunit